MKSDIGNPKITVAPMIPTTNGQDPHTCFEISFWDPKFLFE